MCRVFRTQAWGRHWMTDAGGVVEISRWCKPPVAHTEMRRAPREAAEGRDAISVAPAGAPISMFTRTGGLHHRLISNVPLGQLAAFPALPLEMQCVLVGL